MKECYFYCSYNDSAYGYELTKAVYDNNGTLTQEIPANTPPWIMKEISESNSIVELFGIDNSDDGAVLIRNSQLLVPDELRKRDKYISALFIGTEEECQKIAEYIISKPLCFSNKLYSVIQPISSAETVSNSYIIDCEKLHKYITEFTNDKNTKKLKLSEFEKYENKTSFMLIDPTLEFKEKSTSLAYKVKHKLFMNASDAVKKLPIKMYLSEIHEIAAHNKQKCSKC